MTTVGKRPCRGERPRPPVPAWRRRISQGPWRGRAGCWELASAVSSGGAVAVRVLGSFFMIKNLKDDGPRSAGRCLFASPAGVKNKAGPVGPVTFLALLGPLAPGLFSKNGPGFALENGGPDRLAPSLDPRCRARPPGASASSAVSPRLQLCTRLLHVLGTARALQGSSARGTLGRGVGGPGTVAGEGAFWSEAGVQPAHGGWQCRGPWSLDKPRAQESKAKPGHVDPLGHRET